MKPGLPLLLGAILLTGCRDDAPSSTGTSPPTHPAATPATRPDIPLDPYRRIETLRGDWQATLPAQPNPSRFPLRLRADDREIWWEPRCAQFVRRYTIDGTSIAFKDKEYKPEAPGQGPPPPCAIGLAPGLMEAWKLLSSATRVQPALGGGVLLSGREGQLLLTPAEAQKP